MTTNSIFKNKSSHLDSLIFGGDEDLEVTILSNFDDGTIEVLLPDETSVKFDYESAFHVACAILSGIARIDYDYVDGNLNKQTILDDSKD